MCKMCKNFEQNIDLLKKYCFTKCVKNKSSAYECVKSWEQNIDSLQKYCFIKCVKK